MKKKSVTLKSRRDRTTAIELVVSPKPSVHAQTLEKSFAEVVSLIQQARRQAFAVVNTALIDLYWQVGEYISKKIKSAAWGESVVEQLAQYLKRHHPDIRGFTRPNLFRMRQFYEIYHHDQKVSALLRQLHPDVTNLFKNASPSF